MANLPQGRFQKKIKGSSFVGVAGKPLKLAPPKLLSCEADPGGTSYRV